MKKRLDQAGWNWVNEPNTVLWAYRTSSKEETGDTPFSLAYGTDAIILVEVGLNTSKIRAFPQPNNDETVREELDRVYEKREEASMKMERSKAMIKAAYDRKVNQRKSQVGELVLWQADALKSTEQLGRNWEGPYKVLDVVKGGVYELA